MYSGQGVFVGKLISILGGHGFLPGISDTVAGAAAGDTVGRGADLLASGGGAAFDWAGYIQAIGILCLLLAAMYGALWAVRRFGGVGKGGALRPGDMRVEGQMTLGPKRSVMVVRILNRRLLLGVTDHSINLLTELEDHHEDCEDAFETVLQDAQDEP